MNRPRPLGVCCVLVLALTTRAPLPAADVPVAEKYRDVVRVLEPFVQREVQAKGLPALSIALVEDQTVVWSRGFGLADPAWKVPATADTVYRVGSVSKLFTDLAVMQLVERGTLDLDVPVKRFLPDFRPGNPFDKEVTLRHLMTHRSGLVRESPLGNYFDPTEPALGRSVESLNRTTLVFPPETRIKYSNAGVAVVGLVLEQTQKQKFARYLSRVLLDPLGMSRSAFEPDPAVTKHLARAVMGSQFGREFPAPTFELGTAPAGSLYSTATDLARFLRMLFARGRSGDNVILKPETLEAMWKPQFQKEGNRGFGLGFSVGELEGRRTVGHGGAIYGFSTELAALPDDRLGVVVLSSRDCTNGVTHRIAEVALKLMLAQKQGKPLPALEETTAVPPERAKALAGRYTSGEKYVDLIERDGRLFVVPGRGGYRAELRARGDKLVVDDRLDYGMVFEPTSDGFMVGKDTFQKAPLPKPAPLPEKWVGLIGEYGWDHNTLYIYEKDGKLHALIEWFFHYPLTEESADVYLFPKDFGLYLGEKLIFTRDRTGRATQVEAASVVFERRKLTGEDGSTFKITPIKPLDELRKIAQAAKPPQEKGDFRKSELIDLSALAPGIKLDIRYATTDNFLGTPLYPAARAYLQKPAAEALLRVHKKLAEQGYGLWVFDAYRPWTVTKIFWEATPEKQRIFVADPSKGSRHNRGCAVDLTLYDLKTGKPVQMPGGYDEMSDRSWADYPGGTSLQRWHRDLLRRAMEAEGFTVYQAEWWHFDYKDWQKYRIGNRSFEEIAAGKQD
jgi:CubicO group peptidase (beta-lactamase class C family)/D-alanyl-D-alanine dipeptidase